MTVGKVLVVEDELNLLEAVKYNLQREGFKVLTILHYQIIFKTIDYIKKILLILYRQEIKES